ncbi:hypothetical protein AAG570_002109 [Ranatra chinensis]|uniref:Uncharacterized protein n=1 Tax=Ranatra chinensis TaxID=642074 RepID=A0ABD0Y733_9HEMI
MKDGAVTYQCKFLDSETYRKNKEEQRIVFSECGTRSSPDPCHTIFQRFASYFSFEPQSDNCNISIYPMADEIYAFGEYPTIHRIDPVTLKTLRSVNVFKKVNIVHHTSHPHVTHDGTMYNVGLAVGRRPAYSIIEFPETKNSIYEKDVFSNARIVAAVPARWQFHPCYMHSFGITDSYYVIIEQPFSISTLSSITLKLCRKAPFDVLQWYDKESTLIHVVSRETAEVVQTFSSETFFFFHIINQYEEKDHVVLDVCIYKDPDIINALLVSELKNLMSGKSNQLMNPRAVRFVLPLKTETESSENLVKVVGSNAKAWRSSASNYIQVSPEVLSNMYCEMPRIKYPDMLGKKYRYFYGIIMMGSPVQPGGLVKVDTVKKTETVWYEEGISASEPVFIPSNDPKEEDDGVVLSSLLFNKDNEKRVALLILDGKTFTELGRTVFDTPCTIPSTFHGWFCDNK